MLFFRYVAPICPRHPGGSVYSNAGTICTGKSSDGWLLTSSTGIAPLRGSPEAALICCDANKCETFKRVPCTLQRTLRVLQNRVRIVRSTL